MVPESYDRDRHRDVFLEWPGYLNVRTPEPVAMPATGLPLLAPPGQT
jgi:hypothetical protein